MPDGKTGRSLHADVERIFSHDCSGKEGESGLPEKSVSVTLQKTCDGVFIKKKRTNMTKSQGCCLKNRQKTVMIRRKEDICIL